jgi:serine/threonine-protein kinase
MAPEQIEGTTVDGRADIYSLGVVLYHMLAGHPPFEGETLLTIAFKHVHETPHALREVRPGIPEEWEALIMRALSKNPDDRYQSAAEMEDALRALDTREIETPAPSSPTPPEPAAAEPVAGANPTRIRAPQDVELAPLPPADATDAGDGAEPAAVGEAPLPVRSSPEPEPAPRSTVIRAGGGTAKPDTKIPARPPDPGPDTAREPAAGAGAAVATLPAPAAPEGAASRGRSPLWVLAAVAGVIVVAAVAFLLLRPGSSPSKTASGPPIATWFPAHFQTPSGLTVGADGAIYVADAGSNKIVKLSPGGKVVQTFGGAGGSGLLRPAGVAVDGQGNVYAADSGHDRVVQFSPSGKMLRTWPSSGSAGNRLHGPADVALGARGNIYVADTGDSLVQHLSASGNWQTPYSGFKHPSGIAVNSRASIFVADTGNNAVEELAWSTDLLNQSKAGQFHAPQGIAIDAAGNVYVADTGNNRIVKLSPNFTLLKTWGGRGQLSGPIGVGVDGNGRIYVADTGNGRVGRLLSHAS